MRFLQLDLIAYGPFTNRSICLPNDGAGLHVVYGSNEAGKSTTLRAITGLLFGIGVQTPDAHLHAMNALRIGGRLRHSSGEERTFIRRKRARETLLDGHENVIDETQLRSWLSVRDAKQYEIMFGLSHVQLRAAGQALADAESAASEAIFGAALSGAVLRSVLGQLGSEAEQLFVPRGTGRVVNKSIAAAAEQRQRATSLALKARQFDDDEKALENANRDLATATTELAALRARHRRFERLKLALPWLRERDLIATRRAELGEGRLVAEDVTTRRQQTQRDLGAAEQTLGALRAKLAHLDAEREALVVPQALVDASAVIKHLSASLDRFKDHRRAEPGITSALMQHRNRQRELLRCLNLADTDPRDLGSVWVEHSIFARVEELERIGVDIEGRIRQQRLFVTDRGSALQFTREQLRTLATFADVGALRNIWQRIESDRDIDRRLADAELALASSAARADEALQGLGLWRGAAADCARLPVPSEASITKLEEAFTEIAVESKDLELARLREKADLKEIDDVLQSARLRALPSEDQLESARGRRQAGWQLVVTAWSGGAAPTVIDEDYAPGVPLKEAYVVAVKKADDLADDLTSHAASIAEYNALQDRRRSRAHDLRRTEDALLALQDRRRQLECEWKHSWSGCDLEPLSPREMHRWRARHETLVRLVCEEKEARDIRQRLRGTVDRQSESMRAGLALAGQIADEKWPWSTLIAVVQQVLSEAQKRDDAEAALQQQVSRLDAEQRSAEAQLRDLEADRAAWEVDWSASVVKLRLPAEAIGAEARDTIALLRELEKEEGQAIQFEKRLNSLKKEIASVSLEIEDLAARHCPGITESDPEVIALELIARHEKAVALAARCSDLERASTQTRLEIQEVAARCEAGERQLEGLLAESGCATLEELGRAEAWSSSFRRLEERSSEIERHLRNLEPSDLIGFADLMKSGQDGVELDDELERCALLMQQKEAEEQEQAKVVGGLQERRRSYAGSDDAAEAAAQAQFHLAEAQGHAERYARLRIAAVLLERAMESYRRKNEGAILQRASNLFQRLTLGRYERLRIEYEGDTAKIRCVRNGEPVEVERALSDGTLDQLFLALRLASLERHLETAESMPLVLDDIFIHFDDERTRAGLEILAELGRRTQVLLLTHHARNVEIARQSLDPSLWSAHSL